MAHQRKFRYFMALSALLVLLLAVAPVAGPAKGATGLILDPDTQFYVRKPDLGALQQIAGLISTGDKADADLIRTMIAIPQAVWITGGAPQKTQQEVKNTVQRAAGKGTVPVLVAYNIPFRDCAQYSAGGATSLAEYEAWIDAFAAGIGSNPAIVILEPDGLGIIPYYDPFGSADGSNKLEWCQPPEADPATAAEDRFALMNYAVDALKTQPNTRVYLDGTHSGWLGAGDAAQRLVLAGVERADGFFLNVSNYQLNERLEKYGAWISGCIAFATDPEEGGWRLGHYEWCASQYYPASPDDFSTWHLTDEWYAGSLGTAVPTTHFVIDTSRNGVGPWQPPAGAYPDPQDWCNPPGRGLGIPTTADTGVDLLDAYLWVKIPGESDGQCTRGTGGPLDPARGVEDPPAGQWFPDMALELVQNANPALP